MAQVNPQINIANLQLPWADMDDNTMIGVTLNLNDAKMDHLIGVIPQNPIFFFGNPVDGNQDQNDGFAQDRENFGIENAKAVYSRLKLADQNFPV